MAIDESTAVDGRYRKRIIDGGVRAVRGLASVETYLWIGLAAALLADVFTTTYGLSVGMTEGNPAMRIVIESAGLAALLGAKLLAVSLGLTLRLRMGQAGAVVPFGLALPWVVAATSNAALLV